MFKSKFSKPLSREKTLEQLFKAPVKLRAKLKSWLNKRMNDRDASSRYAQLNPDATHVTDAQCHLMAEAHACGVSFRALESVFHLRAQSGNSAQRCVWRAEQSGRSPKKTVQTRRKSDAA